MNTTGSFGKVPVFPALDSPTFFIKARRPLIIGAARRTDHRGRIECQEVLQADC